MWRTVPCEKTKKRGGASHDPPQTGLRRESLGVSFAVNDASPKKLNKKLRELSSAMYKRSVPSGSPYAAFVSEVLLPNIKSRVEVFLSEEAPIFGPSIRVPNNVSSSPYCAAEQKDEHQVSQCHSGAAVRLVGLGVGGFHPDESLSGFLQMAALLAMRLTCEAAIRSYEDRNKAKKKVQKDEMQEVEQRNSDPGEVEPVPRDVCGEVEKVKLFTCVYDPVFSSFHQECCKLLSVEIDSENKQGQYRVELNSTQPRSLLIVFAPHCPWALLHNLFTANWPSLKGIDLNSGSEALPPHLLHSLYPFSHLLVVGNDVRECPLSAGKVCFLHPDFLSVLHIVPEEGETRKKKKRGLNSATSGGLRDAKEREEVAEISHEAWYQAFSCTVVSQFRKDIAPLELARRLLKVSPTAPNQIKESLELV